MGGRGSGRGNVREVGGRGSGRGNVREVGGRGSGRGNVREVGGRGSGRGNVREVGGRGNGREVGGRGNGREVGGAEVTWCKACSEWLADLHVTKLPMKKQAQGCGERASSFRPADCRQGTTSSLLS